VKLVGQDARDPKYVALVLYGNPHPIDRVLYNRSDIYVFHPSVEKLLHPHQDIHSCVVRLLGFNQCWVDIRFLKYPLVSVFIFIFIFSPLISYPIRILK
jgi:hypothetical protein